MCTPMTKEIATIATTNPQRLVQVRMTVPGFPNLFMVESGFDQFVTASVNFFVAPPGTPLAVRQQLSQAVTRALANAQVKDAFAKIGAQARPASPDELASYLVQLRQRWAQIVEATRVSVD